MARITVPFDGIKSNINASGKKVTDIYWDTATGEIVIVHED